MGRAVPLGKSFEELEVGQEASFSKTLGECDLYQFAGISGDFNPVHLNEEYAKKTPFGKRISHGILTLSLAGSVLGMMLPGIGTVLVELQVRFRRPVFIGDTITATACVSEKIDSKKRVRMDLKWYNQNDEPVMEGYTILIPPRK